MSTSMSNRIHIPVWRWAQWYTALAAALVLFYVLLTPVWFSLRALAWLAEFRERRRRPTGKIAAHD
jgi:hypothetical protein